MNSISMTLIAVALATIGIAIIGIAIIGLFFMIHVEDDFDERNRNNK